LVARKVVAPASSTQNTKGIALLSLCLSTGQHTNNSVTDKKANTSSDDDEFDDFRPRLRSRSLPELWQGKMSYTISTDRNDRTTSHQSVKKADESLSKYG
jgi:hypothetical protein